MKIQIGNRSIGSDQEPFIILEAGINHNGNISMAKEMIYVAKQSGADAIKFQTFKAEEFISDPNLTFTYQSQGKEITESMLEMFRRYQFSYEEWIEIKNECDSKKIIFLSTPQNISDLELLLKIGVPALKVGSDDFTNIPLLKRYASEKLPLMISCGMADLGEIYDALDATGAMTGAPIMLMLCTSQYPTPANDANLLKLKSLAGAFPGLHLGFSDHTQGPYAAVASCALGACIFEKHFTLDHNLPGPDHWFSENPEGAAEWVNAIRTAKKLLGSPIVQPTPDEIKMRSLARRSITVLKDIEIGETLSPENLGLRRPGTGLNPKLIEQIWSLKVKKSILKNTQLKIGDFE